MDDTERQQQPAAGDPPAAGAVVDGGGSSVVVFDAASEAGGGDVVGGAATSAAAPSSGNLVGDDGEGSSCDATVAPPSPPESHDRRQVDPAGATAAGQTVADRPPRLPEDQTGNGDDLSPPPEQGERNQPSEAKTKKSAVAVGGNKSRRSAGRLTLRKRKTPAAATTTTTTTNAARQQQSVLLEFASTTATRRSSKQVSKRRRQLKRRSSSSSMPGGDGNSGGGEAGHQMQPSEEEQQLQRAVIDVADDYPDRVVNPLVTLPKPSCTAAQSQSGTPSFLSPQQHQKSKSSLSRDNVSSGNTSSAGPKIRAQDFWPYVNVSFWPPDTYPLAYLARFLGYRIPATAHSMSAVPWNSRAFQPTLVEARDEEDRAIGLYEVPRQQHRGNFAQTVWKRKSSMSARTATSREATEDDDESELRKEDLDDAHVLGEFRDPLYVALRNNLVRVGCGESNIAARTTRPPPAVSPSHFRHQIWPKLCRETMWDVLEYANELQLLGSSHAMTELNLTSLRSYRERHADDPMLPAEFKATSACGFLLHRNLDALTGVALYSFEWYPYTDPSAPFQQGRRSSAVDGTGLSSGIFCPAASAATTGTVQLQPEQGFELIMVFRDLFDESSSLLRSDIRSSSFSENDQDGVDLDDDKKFLLILLTALALEHARACHVGYAVFRVPRQRQLLFQRYFRMRRQKRGDFDDDSGVFPGSNDEVDPAPALSLNESDERPKNDKCCSGSSFPRREGREGIGTDTEHPDESLVRGSESASVEEGQDEVTPEISRATPLVESSERAGEILNSQVAEETEEGEGVPVASDSLGRTHKEVSPFLHIVRKNPFEQVAANVDAADFDEEEDTATPDDVPIGKRVARKWTAQDQEAFHQAYSIHGPDWDMVSQLIGRTAHSCSSFYRRYYKEGKVPNYTHWVHRQSTDYVRPASHSPSHFRPPVKKRKSSDSTARKTSDQMKSERSTPKPRGKPQSTASNADSSSEGGSGRWTREEKEIFHNAFTRLGKKWEEIAALLPGRTSKSCCCYYYVTYKNQKRNDDASSTNQDVAPASSAASIPDWDEHEDDPETKPIYFDSEDEKEAAIFASNLSKIEVPKETFALPAMSSDDCQSEMVTLVCDLHGCSYRYALLKYLEDRRGVVEEKDLRGKESDDAVHVPPHRWLSRFPNVDEVSLALFPEANSAVTAAVGARTKKAALRKPSALFSGAAPSSQDAVVRFRVKLPSDVEKGAFDCAGSNVRIVQLDGKGEEGISINIPTMEKNLQLDIMRDFEVAQQQNSSAVIPKDPASESEIVHELIKRQGELRSIEHGLEPAIHCLMSKVVDERLEFEKCVVITKKLDEEVTLERYKQSLERRKEEDLAWQKQLEQDMDAICEICTDGEVTPDNQILFCESCNIPVHQMCYGVDEVPSGDWYCIPCRYLGRDDVALTRRAGIRPVPAPLPICCELCPRKQGAFIRTDTSASDREEDRSFGRWIHAVCAKWQGLNFVRPPDLLEDVTEYKYSFRRLNIQCSLCLGERGAMNQCRQSGCNSWLHVTCARAVGTCEVTHGEDHRGPVTENPWTLLCPEHSRIKKADIPNDAISVESLIEAAKKFPPEPKPPPVAIPPKPFNNATGEERDALLVNKVYEKELLQELTEKKVHGIKCDVCDQEVDYKVRMRCNVCNVVFCVDCSIKEIDGSDGNFRCAACSYKVEKKKAGEEFKQPRCIACYQTEGWLRSAYANPVSKRCYWKSNKKEFEKSMFAQQLWMHTVCAL